ncbi:CRAL/TRIO domain-containing protein [Conidiobolus coronatus NRRL 28638]|uniref:CRAL/TRIO domain-containing protein n=1 Tax=Conidiobolus coronatus (strain ATCC 28846 / CBS 209.66 / NRRL 28638) TaxID=796925 RepID=A0A137PIY5_CONC2|nr:CRAL/TRIO domain-containing protein [Conidiobolus coronatus NRRL 28638]|eukprot:KXN74966.1 CRAL/TRIO domain-containing protein [Conidiobolus coronatus NRRL 28638]
MWKLKEIVVGSSEDPNDIKVSAKSGKELRTSLTKLIRSDHPDVKAIKYLAARNWKAMDSYKMFINSLDFFGEEIHTQVRVEGERSLDINHLKQSEALYYERCNDGRLILYIWACRGYPSKYTADENRKAILNLMNNCYLMLGEHSNVTVVFDMNGLTLANMDMNYLRMMSKMMSDHYPELLNRVLIHDAPWIFNIGVWNVICTFLDPNIKKKIIFTHKDQLKDYIDNKHLPSDLGGLDQFKYKYFPPEDTEAFPTPKDGICNQLEDKREEIFKRFEDSTYSWIQSNSKEDKLKRDEIVDELAAVNAKLYEYEYSHSIYHRMKVIEDYDTINWKAISKN